MRGTLIVDIETFGAENLYTMKSRDFVRLIGYRWRGGETVLTTDLDEIREQIRSARWVVGHNIHSFDLPAIFGVDSDEPLELAMAGRVYDTWTMAVLVHPAPYQYTDRHGRLRLADSPDKMKHWFSLDEQAHQLGVAGKTHDLKALAKEFGGFGSIPVDDPRYRDYLRGDIEASTQVAEALLRLGPLDAYALREQEIEARKAVISANGFRVDRAAAQSRVDELAARRGVIMSGLVQRYDFPTEGAAPWSTNPGKAAILAALADAGVTPDTVDWPRTPAWDKRSEHLAAAQAKIADLESRVDEWSAALAGDDLTPRARATRERWVARASEEAQQLRIEPLPPAFGLSLGGDELIAITAGTDAEELGVALAELKGQRSLAQLALDSTHADGFAHPQITMLQRSGRWSTTNPGLTIWTARGAGAVEKSYFLPDTDDEVLLEIDYSNADARAVAAYSGDERYAERFAPGADGHAINAIAAWGEEKFSADRDRLRQLAKPGGHGWGYRIGAKKLAATWGLPVAEAKTFLSRMNAAFPAVVGWQTRTTAYAQRHGYVVNDWGRRMAVEQGREFTQAPALLGQNATREIVCDALLRMPISVLRKVKAQIHDALVLSVPRANFEECRDYLLRLMAAEFEPSHGGQRIEFPVDAGPPGSNWWTASH